MQGSQLRDEFCSILGGIDGEGLGDDVECLAELSDSDLLLCVERSGKLLEVDAVCHIDRASTGYYLTRLEGALCHADGVMQRPELSRLYL
jgi:hypothetical protein